ncbi:MAG: hypothetical protein LQ341_003982 [Variospora aurantia]|nr:MAG: hypothetical protein LQ341_003982 [Variospora aurantia]
MFKHVPWTASHEEEKKSAEGKKQQQQEEEEESLTTILNIDQRGDLTLLIASIMASMRKAIEMNFDANAMSSSSESNKPLVSEDEKIMNANTDPASADVNALDQEKKLKEHRQKELSAPKMRELKGDALRFIDRWRTDVIERIGSIVNSKEEASSQLHSAPAKTPRSQAAATDKKIDAGSPDSEAADVALHELFPPIDTPLSSLEEPTRILILHSTLLLLLSLEHYIAPSRVLLLYLTSSLHLPLSVLTSDEEKIAKGLLEAAKHMSGDEETQKKAEENKNSRKWKVGLASVAGAALIGVTGGLAAPLVAAGVGSVMGGLGLGATAAAGYLGTVAGSTVIVGGLFGAYGGKMTGQMMDAYAKEVSDFAFLPVKDSPDPLSPKPNDKDTSSSSYGAKMESKDSSSNTSNLISPAAEPAINDPSSRRLRVTIGISGWLTTASDVTSPWRILSPASSEPFALRYELEALMNLGNSISAMVSSAAWGYAKSEMIKHTIFAELTAALWPLAILKISRVVDNPFSVAKARSDKAGELLADALVNKAQGERPVVLVGYSLGARVVYSCLMNLAKRKAFGLVESAVLIGTPCPSTTADWRVMRSVVASRLVNVYSENDYVLGFLYRTSSIQYGVAGLQKIEGLPGVENVDVSATVSGHLRYRYLVGAVLKKIGFEGVDHKAVEEEAAALKHMDEEEEERSYVEKAKAQGKSIVKGADGKILFDKDGKPLMEKVWKGGRKEEEGKTTESGEKGKLETQGKEGKDAHDEEAERLEKEVQEKTQQGLLQGMAQKLHISG